MLKVIERVGILVYVSLKSSITHGKLQREALKLTIWYRPIIIDKLKGVLQFLYGALFKNKDNKHVVIKKIIHKIPFQESNEKYSKDIISQFHIPGSIGQYAPASTIRVINWVLWPVIGLEKYLGALAKLVMTSYRLGEMSGGLGEISYDQL